MREEFDDFYPLMRDVSYKIQEISLMNHYELDSFK